MEAPGKHLVLPPGPLPIDQQCQPILDQLIGIIPESVIGIIPER